TVPAPRRALPGRGRSFRRRPTCRWAGSQPAVGTRSRLQLGQAVKRVLAARVRPPPAGGTGGVGRHRTRAPHSAAQEQGVTQTYECMVLVHNQEVRKGWQACKQAVVDLFTKHNAQVLSARRWDERKLAYPIKG